jgi:hypothetical protein
MTRAFMSEQWTQPAVPGSPWYCWNRRRETFVEAYEPGYGYDDAGQVDGLLARAATMEAGRIIGWADPIGADGGFTAFYATPNANWRRNLWAAEIHPFDALAQAIEHTLLPALDALIEEQRS